MRLRGLLLAAPLAILGVMPPLGAARWALAGTTEESSKINGYAVLQAAAEGASKINGYAVLCCAGEATSKINAYAVLQPASGGGAAGSLLLLGVGD